MASSGWYSNIHLYLTYTSHKFYTIQINGTDCNTQFKISPTHWYEYSVQMYVPEILNVHMNESEKKIYFF